MKFCEHMSQLADVFLVGAGSPCQDLSALKAFRLGLGGQPERSVLRSTTHYQVVTEI